MPEMFEERYDFLTKSIRWQAWLTFPHATTATSARRQLKTVHISPDRRERNNSLIPSLRPDFQVTCLMIFYGSRSPRLTSFPDVLI